AGVVGVCSMDIQVSVPPEPPAVPSPPELPQAARAVAPSAAAGRDFRRVLRWNIEGILSGVRPLEDRVRADRGGIAAPQGRASSRGSGSGSGRVGDEAGVRRAP